MLNIFKKIAASFVEKPDIWFFYAFLVTSTLSIRKVILFYPIMDKFNEYTGIYLYLSDVFLVLTLLSWFFILCNKYIVLSIYNTALIANKLKFSTLTPYSVPRGTFILGWNIFSVSVFIKNILSKTSIWLKKTSLQISRCFYITFFPLFLAIFSLLSVIWSDNQQIAIFRSIKLLLAILLFYFIFKNVPRGTFLKRVLQITMFAGLFQSIIGILQFAIQHSIGFLWLKESILSPEIPGVAKVILNGDIYIRSYGLFPHPNILGGFLVLSIISTLLYLKIFHNSENVPRVPRSREMFHACPVQCSTWNICSGVEHFSCFWGGTFLYKSNNWLWIILSVQCLTLLLTFSKSAIIGLFLALFYLTIKMYSKQASQNVPRGTFCAIRNMIKMFHVEHFYIKLLAILSASILLIFILKPDIFTLLIKSLNERLFYLNASYSMFLENPFFGVGSGQFVFNMQDLTNIQQWQFQPVHNVFLLILNEFGFFALFGFTFFIAKIFYLPEKIKCSTPVQMLHTSTNVPRGTLYEAGLEHCAEQARNIVSERNQPQNLQNVPRGTFLEEHTLDISLHLKSILLAFIFIMLFDHYFWDIQQGQIMLWLILGLIIGINRKVLY